MMARRRRGNPAAARRSTRRSRRPSIHSVAGLLPAGTRPAGEPTVSRAAPHHLGCRARRRRTDPAARRDQPRASRRAVSRRDAGVQPARARGAAAAARRRLRPDRARGADGRLPRALHPRRRDEPVPVRLSRRREARVPLHTAAIARIASRLSGPLLDRIDLTVDVAAVTAQDLQSPPPGETSAEIRDRVVATRARQLARDGTLNSRLQGRALRDRCALDGDARSLVSRRDGETVVERSRT